jgi:hypothetical protein
MLDVMKNPPPVIEAITWKASRVEMPDDGITVLIHTPEDDGEPVWLGWWDGGADTWMTAEGFPVNTVTWWADVPAGPAEPKVGPHTVQVVGATMDDAASMVYGSDGMPSQVKKHHLQWIVRTLLKQLGLSALGGRTLSIDLGNEHSLQVTVHKQIALEASHA